MGEDDNGNTMLTFSGYSEESVDALCESYGFNRDDFLSEIKDMKVVMTFDKKYHVKEINVSFVFGEDENNKEPAFTLTMSYSDYNEAELITDSLNKDRFTKIDDVKILRDVTKLFEDCLEKSECKFTSKIDQRVSSNNGKSEQSEESDVKFYNSEDGFAYSVEAKADRTKVYLDYADGILKTKVGAGNPTSSKQTEEKAREYIANLLGQTAYNPLFVTDAKKDGDSYVLTLGNADISELKSLFSTSGGKLSSSSCIMTITVVDGEVTKIKTNIRLDGMLQTWTIITVDKTIEFYE